MQYFSTEQIETFQLKEENLLFNNTSIMTEIDLADKIIMHRWFYHYLVSNKDDTTCLSIHLSDHIVYDNYKHRFIHSLLIQNKNKNEMPNLYHRLLLLNNNRICLIKQLAHAYQIEIYVLFQVDYSCESETMLEWLKYKLAYENAPVLFENEIDYFDIDLD